MGASAMLIPGHPEGESEKPQFEVSKSWSADTPGGHLPLHAGLLRRMAHALGPQERAL